MIRRLGRHVVIIAASAIVTSIVTSIVTIRGRHPDPASDRCFT